MEDEASTPTPGSPPVAGVKKPWIDNVPWWVVPLLLVGIPLVFAAAAAIAPHAVYDQVIWPDYWGPIKADAEGLTTLYLCPDGSTQTFCAGGAQGIAAHAGYNPVNTASWAVLLGLCLVGAAQILRRTDARMDDTTIYSAAAWVLAGSFFHVLEDIHLFAPPLQYIFITPPIYLLFAAGGIGAWCIGVYLNGVIERAGPVRGPELAVQKLLFVVATPVILGLLIWLQRWPQITQFLNPLWFTAFSLLAFFWAAASIRRKGRVEPGLLVGQMALPYVLLGAAYLIQFALHAWPLPGPQGSFLTPHPIPLALLAVPLAAAVAGLAFLYGFLTVGKFEARGGTVGDDGVKRNAARDYSLALLRPVNLFLIGSQMLDAFATAIGIDIGGYSEKHVLSGGVIDWTRQIGLKLNNAFIADHPTFIGFVPVKLLVSLLVVYAIDAGQDGREKTNPTILGLVKFSIIMVGFGPGVRDFVRMSLGV